MRLSSDVKVPLAQIRDGSSALVCDGAFAVEGRVSDLIMAPGGR